MTWDMRDGGTSRPRRLLYFSNLCDKFFKETTINIVRYEKPMPPSAMAERGASEEVILLLRGAIGVFEAATLGIVVYNGQRGRRRRWLVLLLCTG
jgi:hypothetical protein